MNNTCTLLALLLTALVATGCPNPTPPTPTTATKLVVVFESHDLTDQHAALLASEQLRAALDTRKAWYRFVDKDILNHAGAPPNEILPYLTAAKTETLPVAILGNASDTILAKMPFPSTLDELLQFVDQKGAHRP